MVDCPYYDPDCERFDCFECPIYYEYDLDEVEREEENGDI